MAIVAKKVIQKPKELGRERERWLSMERVINVELRHIDPIYQIRNLIRRPDGRFEFETATKFHVKHQKEIKRMFSLLELESEDMEFIQAKYYLPRAIQKRVKRWALELDVSVSSLVAAILDERAREERG